MTDIFQTTELKRRCDSYITQCPADVPYLDKLLEIKLKENFYSHDPLKERSEYSVLAVALVCSMFRSQLTLSRGHLHRWISKDLSF